MASPDQVYREFAKRTHRTMAAYLSIVAWVRDLDCVAIDREEIVRFWGLAKRVVDQRVTWLQEDVKLYFPFVQGLEFQPKKFAGVFLARRQFPQDTFAEPMTNGKRTKALTGMGFCSAVISLPAEVEMLTELTAIIHGLAEPRFAPKPGIFD